MASNDRRRAATHRTKDASLVRNVKSKDIWSIRIGLQLEHRARNLAFFNLAIDSKLRGCDLVRLRVDDVSVGGRVRDHATIVQKKTGRPVQFEVAEQTRVAIQAWLANAGSGNRRYLFPSRIRTQPHLSTRRHARIVHSWVASAGRDSSAYGTDSMQRTMRGLATAGPHPSEGSMAKSRPLTIEDVSPLGAEQFGRLLLEAAWGMSSMLLSVSAVAWPSPNGYSRQLSRCVARGDA